MLHIFTLCYGKKYSLDNVNSLYKSIKQWYNKPFTFYCYTDKKERVTKGIKKIKLNRELNPEMREAWFKVDFFKKDFIKYKKGDMCIVMDVDQEIVNDPTPLLDMKVPKGGIGSLEKWWTLYPTCQLDGGFYKWHANENTQVYDTFYEDPMKWMTKYFDEGLITVPYFGEQNFVSEMTTKHTTAAPHLAARWNKENHLEINYAYYDATQGDFLKLGPEDWSDQVVLIHYSKFIG